MFDLSFPLSQCCNVGDRERKWRHHRRYHRPLTFHVDPVETPPPLPAGSYFIPTVTGTVLAIPIASATLSTNHLKHHIGAGAEENAKSIQKSSINFIYSKQQAGRPMGPGELSDGKMGSQFDCKSRTTENVRKNTMQRKEPIEPRLENPIGTVQPVNKRFINRIPSPSRCVSSLVRPSSASSYCITTQPYGKPTITNARRHSTGSQTHCNVSESSVEQQEDPSTAKLRHDRQGPPDTRRLISSIGMTLRNAPVTTSKQFESTRQTKPSETTSRPSSSSFLSKTVEQQCKHESEWPINQQFDRMPILVVPETQPTLNSRLSRCFNVGSSTTQPRNRNYNANSINKMQFSCGDNHLQKDKSSYTPPPASPPSSFSLLDTLVEDNILCNPFEVTSDDEEFLRDKTGFDHSGTSCQTVSTTATGPIPSLSAADYVDSTRSLSTQPLSAPYWLVIMPLQIANHQNHRSLFEWSTIAPPLVDRHPVWNTVTCECFSNSPPVEP